MRRLGQEFLDYAINPLVGVYAGDPARLSVKHAFLKLHALEQKYGSLIKGQILGRASASAGRRTKRAQGLVRRGTPAAHRHVAPAPGDAVRLNTTVAPSADHRRLMVVGRRRTGGARASTRPCCWPPRLTSWLELPVHDTHAIDLSPLARSPIRLWPASCLASARGRGDPLDGFGMLIPQVEGFNIFRHDLSSSLFP